MSKTRMVIKRNDTVQVIAGKEKGKRGKVLRVFPDRARALVEKVNIIKRHTRPTQENQQGGIIEKEGTMHVSNIMPDCSKCDAPVRIRHQTLEDKKKVRVCAKCNEPLDRI
jgi:large subunit ribosomal protein L24